MNSLIYKAVCVICLCIFISVEVYCQGRIAGKVVDKATGETVIGATVTVKDTSAGAATDLDGNYLITLPAGTYSISVEYLGYQRLELNGVVVKNNETTPLNATISEGAEELKEVVVQGQLRKETADALLIQQKNTVANVSGISAEQFRKLPDRTTGDVLKRVSGASIQDNKFAVIRGLGDRYNMALLNGTPMPSTESDRKAFSFDLIPSNLLDNMVIAKTATPDMQGDFAGGIIQINTRDIPEENFQSLSLGVGTHSLTTFKKGINGESSPTDFIGVDNGSRNIPNGILPTHQSGKLSTAQVVEQSKLWEHNFTPRQIKSVVPNFSGQYSLAKRIDIHSNPLGILFAVTYNSNRRITPFENNIFQNPASQVEGSLFNNNLSRTQVLAGSILNVSYRIGQNTKFSFKNLYNINSENYANVRTGKVMDGSGNNTLRKDYAFFFSSNKMYSGQLAADHVFPSSRIKIKAIVGYNKINREVPDYRKILYEARFNEEGELSPYQASISLTGNFNSNTGRLFSTLEEHSYNGTYEVLVPIEAIRTDIKIGGFHQNRKRDFNMRTFVYLLNSMGVPPAYLQKEPEEIFQSGHFNSKGLGLRESYNTYYNAYANTNAGFIMFDNKLLSKLRLIWGARIENYYQNVVTQSEKGQFVSSMTNTDPLPSATLIYNITPVMNVKASASRTVSRPEFREVAPVVFYDFNSGSLISGNSHLIRARINNYDLKIEYYPTAGETFSITPFYKFFRNPIELLNNPGSQGIRQYDYQNQIAAENYGVELEARKRFFENFILYGNLALIKSKINLDRTNTEYKERPLQGQSPYVLNAGIQYNNEQYKFNTSLTINNIGRRIAYANDIRELTIWEKSRTVLDFQISKTFIENLEVRFILGDILSQGLIFYHDLDQNSKYNEDIDRNAMSYKTGYTTNIGVSYKF